MQHHSRGRQLGAAVATVAIAALISCTATATVLQDLELADLAERADAIVIGTVGTKKVSQPVPGGHIWTDTNVSVDEWLKGVGPESFTIRQKGGRIGNQARILHGNASLRAGERVLLFVLYQDGYYFTVGMELGKYEIYTDSNGHDRVRRHTTVPVARNRAEPLSLPPLGTSDTTYQGARLSRILADISEVLAGPAAPGVTR
jgi:hypothetical protein